MSELHEADRRLAVLEQIVHSTDRALLRIEAELRLLRTEMQAMRTQQHDDFRWLLRFMIAGFVGVLALIAHGLRWF